MMVLAGSTSIDLAKDLAEKIRANYSSIDVKIFPDGESYIRIPEITDDHVILVSSLYYPQDTHLFQILNSIATLKRIGVSRVTLVTPYLCYARSDRDILGQEAISILTVFKLLESVGVDHLITFDIHNPEVFKETSMKTTNIIPAKSLANFLIHHDIDISKLQVVAPDKGASERAKIIAEEIGVEWTTLSKTRDPRTGEISMVIGDADIKSTEILLVDDLTSTGSSLIRASNILRVYGAKNIHIFITHLMNPQIIEKIQEVCNGILVSTNSIPSLISNLSPVEDIIGALSE